MQKLTFQNKPSAEIDSAHLLAAEGKSFVQAIAVRSVRQHKATGRRQGGCMWGTYCGAAVAPANSNALAARRILRRVKRMGGTLDYQRKQWQAGALAVEVWTRQEQECYLM